MTTRPTPKEVFTLTEAAAYLRISPRAARRLAERGDLPHFTLPGMTPRFVALDDLRAYVKDLTAKTMASLPIDPATDAPVDFRFIA